MLDTNIVAALLNANPGVVARFAIAYDGFGESVSLSPDGTRLAVGAIDESSSATGVGGDQADDGATSSGAVYVY